LLENLAKKKRAYDASNAEYNESEGSENKNTIVESNFTSAQFYGLLKECLDDLIASRDASA